MAEQSWRHKHDAVPQRLPLLPDRPRDGRALDELHHEVALALGHAAIVQAHDVRMIERGQDLPLLDEAALRFGREDPATGHLQRHRPVDLAIGAHGAVHRPHAAASELLEQAIRTDDRPGAVRRRGIPTASAGPRRARRAVTALRAARRASSAASRVGRDSGAASCTRPNASLTACQREGSIRSGISGTGRAGPPRLGRRSACAPATPGRSSSRG